MKLPLSLQKLVNQTHQQQQTLVLVTGVFDLLHQEHRHFLQKAKAAGDALIVGLESDQRVRQLKGPGRPINTAKVRQQNLAALEIADAVFVLPAAFNKAEQHQQLIQQLKPQVLAVSAHTPNLAQKRQILARFGGRVVVVHQHNPQISTTKLINSAAT
ncbi:MAG: adenylyltransferase/cytidyltransferase family protein [Candidatus Pacebacteria bacterium]|nr:adenylyltransferase/cytidyltransferase family protein [Candidatus Paceibacterota bacterium]